MISESSIVFEGKKRYYKENLLERDYLLENTTPHKFLFQDYVIEESSWGELLRSVVTLLISLFPDREEGLTSFQCSWTKSLMFTNERRTNYKLIGKDKYINCNHTALHSCWFLQDILDYFLIDKGCVTLLIHRPSSAETPEIKKIILEKVYLEFKVYLQYAFEKDETYSNKVINNINKYLNPILRQISKSHSDVFLFDDYTVFSLYSKKIRERIERSIKMDDKSKKVLSKYLDYLSNYYKL